VGGAHPPAAKGVGESQFHGLEKRLALCLLCAFNERLQMNTLSFVFSDGKLMSEMILQVNFSEKPTNALVSV
jgi:hypothetical protein